MSDTPSITLSTAEGKIDYITMHYNSSSDQFDVVDLNRGV